MRRLSDSQRALWLAIFTWCPCFVVMAAEDRTGPVDQSQPRAQPRGQEETKELKGLDNTPPGGTLPGGTLPGGTLPGGTLPGGTLPGGTLPGGTLPGGTLPGGTLPGGTLPGGTL